MNALRKTAALAAGMMLVASIALAQSASSGTEARSSATAEVKSAAGGGAATMNADAEARAAAYAALRQRVEERSAKVKAEEQLRAETEMATDAHEVDHTAEAQGEAKVAGRIAGEFGMSADAVSAERQALNASWGELTIAHTIAANSKTDVTVEQLIAMKNDGLGWGRIAAGLDLRLGSVVSAVKAEGRVASGISRADGRVASMRGVGARPSAGLGIKAGGTGRGVSAGVGAGVKVKP